MGEETELTSGDGQLDSGWEEREDVPAEDPAVELQAQELAEGEEEAEVLEEEPPVPSAPRLDGAWTAPRAPELLALFREWCAAGADVSVDCASLERVDTCTLQVLVAASRALASHGAVLTLRDLPENVRRAAQLAVLETEAGAWT